MNEDNLSEQQLALRRDQIETYLDLTRIDHWIDARSSELFELERLTEVTPAQSNILLVLLQAKQAMTASKLASQLALSEVTVSRFLRTLERNGWVERLPDPADRRALFIHPTQKTRDTLPRFIAVANALLDDCFAGFEAEEIQVLGRALARIRGNLQRQMATSSAT